MGRFGEKSTRGKTEVVWHCREEIPKYDGYIVRRMLRIDLSGSRKLGRPKSRCMDAV